MRTMQFLCVLFSTDLGINIFFSWPSLPHCLCLTMLSHLAESCSLLSLLPGFMLSSLPSPPAQPLHRFGPYCLGSAIEYSIRSVCWSSKLPCVKSIPLAPGGVVISLKMKLPLVSSPYSSTLLFSLAAWEHAVVRLCGGSLLDKSSKNAAEVLWYQVVKECSTVSYKYISHAGLELTLIYIFFFSCFGINAVQGDCIVPYGRKWHQVPERMLR